MARRTGPETVADWTARNAVTVKAAPVAASVVMGYGKDAKHFKITLDRDGADGVFFCNWIDDGKPTLGSDPTPVIASLVAVSIDVEEVKTDGDAVRARYAMEDPEKDWRELFKEIVDLRTRFMAWCGPVEFAKVVKAAQGGESI